MKKTLILSIFFAAILCLGKVSAQGTNKAYKDLTLKEAFAMMKNDPNVVLLDVRTPGEFTNTSDRTDLNIGKLKGAINIPVDELSANLNKLEKYKDKKIIVYCSHAHRSVSASEELSSNGFKHIYNMLGGLSVVKATSEKDLPLKKDFYIP
jgi:rhodanese-related sulfurtransferase